MRTVHLIRLTIRTLAVVFIIVMILPETWAAEYHFGEVPLGSIMLAAISSVLILGVLRAPSQKVLSAGLLSGIAALFLMALYGYFRGNIELYSLKFFVFDVYVFGAMLVGYTLVRILGSEDSTGLITLIAMIAVIAIILTYAALFAGIVRAGIPLPENRRVTSSIYDATSILLVLLPWASAAPPTGWLPIGWRTGLMFAAAAGTGLLSATRSCFIETALAVCLCVVLRRHRFNVAFVLSLFVGLALLLFLGLPASDSIIFERFAGMHLGDEVRYQELSLYWDQISGDLIAGQGIGSRFVSNMVINGNPLASAPHIGIATFLIKGGVIAFVAWVILPLFLALPVLFSPRLPTVQRGAAASVLMFLGGACLSGGWSPLPMFAYGLAISAMIANKRRHVQLSGPLVTSATSDGLIHSSRTLAKR